MALRRKGNWALHKIEDGKYVVREGGSHQATILTSDFNQPSFEVGLDTYEVADFNEVESKFKELPSGSGVLF